ncbi:MAG: FAD-binding oxidoreductase [Promethearchaeota archaeon]
MKQHIITARAPTSTHFPSIRTIVGKETIEIAYSMYLIDESKVSLGKAEWLFFPRTTNELASTFIEMQKQNQKITISGARTGIVGGCVPNDNEAIVSLEKMDKITGIRYDKDTNTWYIKSQAGVTLKELNEKIISKDFSLETSCEDDEENLVKFKEEKQEIFFPIDPTETTASLGGMVAADASGARSYKYGATRAWVNWIQVVLTNGDILDIPRGKYFADNRDFIIKSSTGQDIKVQIPDYQMPKGKNAAGLFAHSNMDLIDLFIGSEGILGAITEVEFKLAQKPETITVAQFFPSDEDAIGFVLDMRQKDKEGIDTEFMEFMDSKSLDLLRKRQDEDPKFIDMPLIPPEAKSVVSFDVEYSDDSLVINKEKLAKLTNKHNSSLALSWAGYEEREKARFKHFRHALPETVNSMIAERKKTYPNLHKLGTDMAVPPEYFQDMFRTYIQEFEKERLEFVIFGHIGDCHVHCNILPRNMEELEIGKKIYKKFAEIATKYEGTVSAEHGIGKIKKEYLQIMFQEKDIQGMIGVKKTLDPHLMLNIGTLFDIKDGE